MNVQRNDPCWCGSGKKWKKCHYPQTAPVNLTEHYLKQYKILLKTPEQVSGIREACHMTAHILEQVCRYARVGMTTNDLDAYVAKLLKEVGATSACLHYGTPPFPKSLCTSVNEVVCHGIPNDLPLQEGDIVNLDIALKYKGYYGDSSRMVIIGQTTPQRRLVCDVAYTCLMQAIEICRPGVLLSEIGRTIEDYATTQGCSVIYQFVGHGVGLAMHEPPQIPHSYNKLSIPMAPGMIFTIEPMINAGTVEITIDSANQWEARTRDGLPSAQWEHTILITDTGYEILTSWN